MFKKLFLALAISVFFSIPVLADTYLVNTSADTLSCTSTNCSLRGAIIEANHNPGADTILFDASLSGPIELTLSSGSIDEEYGDLDVTAQNPLEIIGNGVDETIVDANFIDRVLQVHPGASLTISDLSLTGGYLSTGYGAGIFNEGNFIGNRLEIYENEVDMSNEHFDVTVLNHSLITLIDSKIYNNHSTGMLSYADDTFFVSADLLNLEVYDNAFAGVVQWGASDLYAQNIQIADNNSHGFFAGGSATTYLTGGAIKNNAGAGFYTNNKGQLLGVTIEGNSFDNPDDYQGGVACISSSCDLLIDSSTISNNYSTNPVYSGSGHAAGLMISGGNVYLHNSTVSGNYGWYSNGGVSVSSANLYISQSTIADNASVNYAGGIANISANIQIKNSILAGNYSFNAEQECRGEIISDDYNIVLDPEGCDFLAQSHDLLNIDPLLAALQSNGGPTKTHKLRNLSPALNWIPSSSCVDYFGANVLTDQRGYSRDSQCDVGAFERIFSEFGISGTYPGLPL